MIASSFKLIIEQNLGRATPCHESNHTSKSHFLLMLMCLFLIYIDQWTFVCQDKTKRDFLDAL